ncbi:MAG: PD-(D/E)XK nuclease family protein, partial [Longimicrobiales bacterium]
GVRATLELAPAEAEIDRAAKDRLVERLERIEATLTRMTTLRGALATLIEKLDERVPAPEAGGRAPWLSSGGRLHFTDIDGAGQSGRRLTFIVGLDAGRFPDVSMSDALLSDRDRRRLGAGRALPALPTSAERIEERRHAFAAALARVRGKVTLSYAAWSAAEGRTVAPSSELLQAFRLQTGNADADYEALQRALAPHASAVPRAVVPEPAVRGAARRPTAVQPGAARAPAAQLDASDVWLGALDDHGLLRRGDTVVAAAYPALARGLAGVSARAGDVPTAFHGVLRPRPSFDPRGRDVPMSASRLQTLGTCPHRYLVQVVLGVRPPRDPDDDPARWLTALERGAALHEVFEQTLREARKRGVTPDGESVRGGARTLHDIAASVLDAVLTTIAAEQPPPGPAVRDAERRALHADVRAFVRMLVDEPREWIALEAAFGEDDAPVTLELAGGPLRIRGKIDRIDRTADDALVVVDYKTGSIYPFRRETGTYAGGRRLQHAFYAAGAEALHEGVVQRVEYQFPGERGRNESAVYEHADIHDAPRLIDHLVDMAARGWFVPTDDEKEDCRYCDVRAVCRVRVSGSDKVDSPLADWSARMLDSDA